MAPLIAHNRIHFVHRIDRKNTISVHPIEHNNIKLSTFCNQINNDESSHGSQPCCIIVGCEAVMNISS